MAITIIFSGYSDDTFGWEASDGRGDDHDDCAAFSVRTYHLNREGHRMAVTGVYGKGCNWSVGIAPIEEGDPMPPWPMKWEFDGYSTILTLTVPDGATPILVCPNANEDHA